MNTPETPGTPTPEDDVPAPEPAEDAPEPTGDAPPVRPAADRSAADGDGTAPRSAPEASGAPAGGPAASGPADDRLDEDEHLDGDDRLDGDRLDGDEVALQRMLHGAVGGLEPSAGALDHLRRAVPARRARKRQALVGAAAAVILFGTGVPALVHVAASDGASDTDPVNAGHGAQVENGGSASADGPGTGSPSGAPGATGKDRTGPGRSPSSAGTGASAGTDGTPGLATTSPAALPACAADQLAVSVAEVGAPGGDGTVYGTFRIANASAGDCSVDAAGTVGFSTSGAADPGRVSVVGHTSQGAAPGLPDPSAAVGSLVLKPSAAYEVRFAWVPSETCPVDGDGGSGGTDGGSSGDGGGDGGAGADGGGDQSPEPTSSPSQEEPPPAADGTSTRMDDDGSTAAPAAPAPQMMRQGGLADGSVNVTYTPRCGRPPGDGHRSRRLRRHHLPHRHPPGGVTRPPGAPCPPACRTGALRGRAERPGRTPATARPVG
ncbi:hypothetical protein LUX01_11080 [Streptomyces sudanensis]|uniref:hypothetical protein n=1 Tax=Streptomyces sudanensis TaxID=436397 RepID=UPI0020CB7B7B|nr:hypothetical protein [Streptomyces sudanensis]MCP9987151.1 hypothetical protein [Streptomyces sudanensis]